jgi:hypothetical protein
VNVDPFDEYAEAAPPGDLRITDQWDRLSRNTRRKLVDLGREAVHETTAGIPDLWDACWKPLRPLLLPVGSAEHIASIARTLMSLSLESCRRRARTAGQLLAATGHVPEDFRLLVPSERLEGKMLLDSARPDVILENGVPKLIELNVDSAVGTSHDADRLARRYRETWRTAFPDPAVLSAALSAVDARSAAMSRFAKEHGLSRMLIPTWAGGTSRELSDESALHAYLAAFEESARRFGIEVERTMLDAVQLDDSSGRVLANGRHVDLVLRLFFSADVPAESAGLGILSRAVRTGAAHLYTSEASTLASSKVVLAWLYDDLALFGPRDRSVIRKHLPWTSLLSTVLADDGPVKREDVLRAKDRLVLKPANGHGGKGVVFGSKISAGAWRETVRDLEPESGQWVVQRRVVPDPVHIPFLDSRTRAVEEVEVGCIVGPYLFSGDPAGFLVRHPTPAVQADVPVNLRAGNGVPNTALFLGGR